MRLLDSVTQSRNAVTIELAGHGRYLLPGAAARAEMVAGCPLRYVRDDAVRAVCRRIIDQWPALLDPADMRLRAPAERLWMEWAQPAPAVLAAPGVQACGLLAECDPSGRRGRVESFWQDPTFGADRAQLHAEFDLDRPLAHRVDGRRTFAIPHGQGLDALARHVVLCVDPGWLDYFDAAASASMPRSRIVEACARSVWRDLPMLLAFGRLLEAHPAFDTREIVRGKLNAARVKRGKPALLDHVELGLRIGRVDGITATGRSQSRNDARLHLVRGHIVNRRGRLFWRSSHLRGRPDLAPVVTRTSRVSLEPGFRADGGLPGGA